MRTPDNEAEGTEAQSAEASVTPLADGFGGAGDGEMASGEADNAFGSGWPSTDSTDGTESTAGTEDESYETPFLQQQDQQQDQALEPEGTELSAFEFEPDYVPDTDTDMDLTGDGVVDDHDFHEATTGLHDFHVDSEDSHGHAQNEGFFHSE
jgi:hypothetical protein